MTIKEFVWMTLAIVTGTLLATFLGNMIFGGSGSIGRKGGGGISFGNVSSMGGGQK